MDSWNIHLNKLSYICRIINAILKNITRNDKISNVHKTAVEYRHMCDKNFSPRDKKSYIREELKMYNFNKTLNLFYSKQNKLELEIMDTKYERKQDVTKQQEERILGI